MQIGIIGAGNVGRALSTASVRAGHTVTVTSTNDEEATQLASDLGIEKASSNADAISKSEVVILAVPADAIPSIAQEASEALRGKVLIDVTNRFEPEQMDGTSNAELTQQKAPDARVVKAFNTILAANQSDPMEDGVQLDGFVAGDDPEAKRKVLDLVQSLGFRPIDAGPLAMSRALEAMGLLNISLNMQNRWPWQTGWKLVGPTG
jgi:8-hydroxy-5-deazaflavin:NADPH oxidoreductase